MSSAMHDRPRPSPASRRREGSARRCRPSAPSHHVLGNAYGGRVRFSISIPQRAADGFDAEGTSSYLARAEELGFEGGWTLEQIVAPAPSLAPLQLLSWAAAHTTRLRLGVAVLITSLHDPLQLASAITAVDQISHGRLDVGVGHGGNFRPFSAFGVDKATFISYFAEAVKIVRRELDEQSKDETQFRIAKRVYLTVDDDAARAHERVLAGLHRIYGDMPGIEAVPVSGTPDDVVRGLLEVVDAGAEMILLNPVGENVSEDRHQMERLAAEVIPQLS